MVFLLFGLRNMKKSEILKSLENKFDYLPRREVERTLEKILQYFFCKFG